VRGLIAMVVALLTFVAGCVAAIGLLLIITGQDRANGLEWFCFFGVIALAGAYAVDKLGGWRKAL
jgi:hypothetical protein